MSDVFSNRPEILEAKGALQAAVRKATLRAWITNPPSDALPVPEFITALRSKLSAQTADEHPRVISSPDIGKDAEAGSSFDALFGSAVDLNFDTDFGIGNINWMLWDQSYCEPNTLSDNADTASTSRYDS